VKEEEEEEEEEQQDEEENGRGGKMEEGGAIKCDHCRFHVYVVIGLCSPDVPR